MQQRKPLKRPYLLCINGCIAEWLQHWQVEEPRTASLRIHGTTYLHQLTFRIVGHLHYCIILVCVKVEQLHKPWRYKQDWELFNAPTTSKLMHNDTTNNLHNYSNLPTCTDQLIIVNTSRKFSPSDCSALPYMLFYWSCFRDGQLLTKTQLRLSWSVPVTSLRIQQRDDLFNTGISKDYSGKRPCIEWIWQQVSSIQILQHRTHSW